MTKRKAIEAAIKAFPLSRHQFYIRVMENLWEQGRIAKALLKDQGWREE